VAVSAQQVKELRERTGAGMMDCKRALEDANGDAERASVILRERGLLAAAKKASRAADEGLVMSYIHPGGRIGALLELNCETDFVAGTDDFQNLGRDIGMQIAAQAPRWVSREDVPADVLEAERAILRTQAEGEGKPAKIVEQIVEGRLAKFLEANCLLDQPFVKNPDQTVGDLVKEHTARLGENIRVRRFVRFQRGDTTP
jgi:elongation factor Ts